MAVKGLRLMAENNNPKYRNLGVQERRVLTAIGGCKNLWEYLRISENLQEKVDFPVSLASSAETIIP